jgi:hypothetical protein
MLARTCFIASIDLARETMADSPQSKIEKEARRVESLDTRKRACWLWLAGTVILGPLIFLGMVGTGEGSNTGGVFPDGGIIVVILCFPLSLLLSGFALWYFAVESRASKARLAEAREEPNQSSVAPRP